MLFLACCLSIQSNKEPATIWKIKIIEPAYKKTLAVLHQHTLIAQTPAKQLFPQNKRASQATFLTPGELHTSAALYSLYPRRYTYPRLLYPQPIFASLFSRARVFSEEIGDAGECTVLPCCVMRVYAYVCTLCTGSRGRKKMRFILSERERVRTSGYSGES